MQNGKRGIRLALVVIAAAFALSAPAASQSLELGDVASRDAPSGVEFKIVTEKGFVAFTIPADWRVIAMQSQPPVSVAGFEVPNPADEGTSDSINVAVTIFHLDSDSARAAQTAVGKQFGSNTPMITQRKGWTLYEQEAQQGATEYTVIDAIRDLPEVNVAVAVRIAWPHLASNEPTLDSEMRTTDQALLDSIYAKPGPYAPGPSETARRKAGRN
jgi:hypothetical protein